MPKVTDKTLDALLACARPADAARVLSMDGKALRNVLRSRFGVFVSHGHAFDDKAKHALYAYVGATDTAARNAIVEAFKA